MVLIFLRVNRAVLTDPSIEGIIYETLTKIFLSKTTRTEVYMDKLCSGSIFNLILRDFYDKPLAQQITLIFSRLNGNIAQTYHNLALKIILKYAMLWLQIIL